MNGGFEESTVAKTHDTQEKRGQIASPSNENRGNAEGAKTKILDESPLTAAVG